MYADLLNQTHAPWFHSKSFDYKSKSILISINYSSYIRKYMQLITFSGISRCLSANKVPSLNMDGLNFYRD